MKSEGSAYQQDALAMSQDHEDKHSGKNISFHSKYDQAIYNMPHDVHHKRQNSRRLLGIIVDSQTGTPTSFEAGNSLPRTERLWLIGVEKLKCDILWLRYDVLDTRYELLLTQ